MKKRKTRGIGIRTKILFPTSVAIVLLCVVMGMNSYLRTKESLIAMGVEEAQMAATISAKSIDVDLLASMSVEDQGSEEYNALRDSMNEIKNDCGIKYMY